MLYPASFGTGDNGGLNDLYRQYNYDLCTAVDLTKLSIILEKMVSSGHMNKQMAVLYKEQGAVLLNLLRSENNRAFGK